MLPIPQESGEDLLWLGWDNLYCSHTLNTLNILLPLNTFNILSTFKNTAISTFQFIVLKNLFLRRFHSGSWTRPLWGTKLRDRAWKGDLPCALSALVWTGPFLQCPRGMPHPFIHKLWFVKACTRGLRDDWIGEEVWGNQKLPGRVPRCRFELRLFFPPLRLWSWRQRERYPNKRPLGSRRKPFEVDRWLAQYLGAPGLICLWYFTWYYTYCNIAHIV